MNKEPESDSESELVEDQVLNSTDGSDIERENDDESGPEVEIAELKDKLLRTLAENENTIRRAKREREDTAKYAAANFARDMLTVADNLQRALDVTPAALRDVDEQSTSFLEGIELTSRELLSICLLYTSDAADE